MPNGTGLMGNWSSTQSATIVPMPGSSTLFYVFTLDYEAHANGFRYSIVDISLGGGLGGVTSSKNILIYTPSNEKLSIVKHSNGIDFWIVTHGWQNNSFYSYLLSPTGLSAIPVTSNVGTVVNGTTDFNWGYMKISPDGSRLAICNTRQNCQLFDFNNATGVVSNPLTIINAEWSYGIEFSPNSKVLYVSVTYSNTDIYQFDLTASNIVASAQVFNVNIANALQLAPNGKIYMAVAWHPSLGVINNPNIIGVGCGIQPNAVDLLGRNCKLGLPPFISTFFYTAPVINLSSYCENQTINFSFSTNQSIVNVLWDFGDGATSNLISPNHVYTNAGNYNVTTVITTPNNSINISKSITIFPQPILLTNTVTLKQCDDNNDGYSAFNLKEAIPLLGSYKIIGDKL